MKNYSYVSDRLRKTQWLRSNVMVTLRSSSPVFVRLLFCYGGLVLVFSTLQQVEATEVSRKAEEGRVRQTAEGILTLKREN